MSTKNARSGGKYSGSHTTVTPFAGEVCDLIHPLGEVTKITLGIIKAGLKSPKNGKAVKISTVSSAILLSIRDNTSCEDVYIYSNNLREAKLAIAKKLRDNKIRISFGKE